MSSPRIVVVGGGGGGSHFAKTIAAKLPNAKVTLINSLPYALWRPALLRMTVSEANNLLDTASGALIPYDRLFSKGGNGVFVHGTVERITPTEKGDGGEVVLVDGQTIGYDVLVLAPGSRWDGPIEMPNEDSDVRRHVREARAKYSQAKKIVLVGGGAVGAELSGEIKDVYPKTEVTIVHGDSALLNKTYPAKFRKSVEKAVLSRGVKLVLEDYIDEIPEPGHTLIKTRNGKTIEADLVIPTRGPKPRTAFVAESLGAEALNAQDEIKVTPTLQLAAHPRIFAIGDAIAWAEQKQVMKAQAHAAVVADNVAALLSGRALKPYGGSKELILVTNGKNGGRAYFGILWGIVIGDWLARMAKGKELLVPMARGGFNQ